MIDIIKINIVLDKIKNWEVEVDKYLIAHGKFTDNYLNKIDLTDKYELACLDTKLITIIKDTIYEMANMINNAKYSDDMDKVILDVISIDRIIINYLRRIPLKVRNKVC